MVSPRPRRAQQGVRAWMARSPRSSVLRAAALLAVVVVAGTLLLFPPSPPEPPQQAVDRSGSAPATGANLVPICGVLTGVAANPERGQSWRQALAAFEGRTGAPVDIAHFYHKSPQLFPTREEIAASERGGRIRLLLLNWKPELGRTWAQVAAGDPAVDAAIDAEARYLRRHYTRPFFLTVHHEPEDEVDPGAGSGMTAEDYARMYRHVVQRLRADGVANAVTVMDYAGSPRWGSARWFADLYPGDDVVDWIAEDPYVYPPVTDPWTAFARAVDRRDPRFPSWPGFVTWLRRHHPGKPLMLGEWGVDAKLGPHITAEVLAAIKYQVGQFPELKAMVYWNSPRKSPAGLTRVDSSDQALSAYSALIAALQTGQAECSAAGRRG